VKAFNVHENYLIFPQTHTATGPQINGKISPSERANFPSPRVSSLPLMMMAFRLGYFIFLSSLLIFFGCFQVNHSLLCIECRALILAILFHISSVSVCWGAYLCASAC